MKKKNILFFIFFFLSQFPCNAQNENLIKNGSFEIERSGYVVHWSKEAYEYDVHAVRFFSSDKEYYKGKKSFGIANLKLNVSKIIQWIEVEPDSLYKLSCRIKAKQISGTHTGAYISVLGIIGTSESVFDTGDKWEYVEVHGQTGPGQEELAVVAGLGFHENPVSGIAYFDVIGCIKVNKSPERIVLNFYNSEDRVIFLEDKGVQRSFTGNDIVFITLLIIIFGGSSALILIVYVYVFRPYLAKRRKQKLSSGGMGNELDIMKRKAVRRKLQLNVIVKYPTRKGGFKEMIFHSLNISMGGVFIQVDDLDLFKVGDKIELGIEKKGRQYDIGKAKIVRLQKEINRKGIVVDHGIGIQFLAADPTHITWIMSIMGETTGKKALL